MQRVLVPTDFSEPSKHALKLANKFMSSNGGEIILLHVIEPMKYYISAVDGLYMTPSSEENYIKELVEHATKRLDELSAEVISDNVKVVKTIEVGNFFKLTKEFIKSTESDLVIMGTQGISGLDEILIGSNTEKIVRTSSCPVLTVREFSDDMKVDNIVFATNLKKDNLKIVEKIEALRSLLDNPKLHVLFVNYSDNFCTNREIEKLKTAFFAELNIENYEFHIYNERNQENGILYFSEDNKMDLIIVASHQRRGLAHLISGSVSEDVVNHSKIPVLSFGLKKK